MIQWRRFVFYYICCLTVIKTQVEGCVETFPDLLNSKTVCSNLTNQCTVSCVENHIYYDGDITKTYSCNDNNIWSPFVPKTGCLDKKRAIFWMRFNVSYRTTQVAAYCLEAHEQALVDNEDLLTQQVSFYCNNTLINVGRISINKTTSTTSSFKINTVFELEIGDSATINIVKEACRLLLINNVKLDNFMVYGDRLECRNRTSNVTKQNATAESDVSRCPYSYLLVVDSDNGDYCVPNIPVVGVKSFLYSANISQDIVLHCDLLYGSSLSSVYWQHDGLNLTYSSKKYNGSTIDSPSLIIYNVTYDDDGEYTCNVGSGEGSSPVIILNILARVEDIPDVAIKKDEYIVIAGGNITLECTVTSFPEVDDVVWLRNTSGSTEQITADGIKFSGSNSTSPSLTISSADLADSGMYTCTATNVAGTGISIPAELYVSGDIPTVHRTNELYTVVLGNNITMNCNYSSDPPATHVQWKYNNSDSLLNIPIGKERYTGSIPPNPSLTIINTTFQDSGMYLCMVTNYLGSDVSDSIILQIIGEPPIVDVSPLIYSVIVGDNQTMMCNVTGIPEPLSVSWLKNETAEMKIISYIGGKYDGGNLDYPSLIVMDTANTDRGWYICTATNLAGKSHSEPVYLNVTGDKPYVEITSETFRVVFGDNITIDCSVSSHPAVTSIQWQWNTTDGLVDIVIDYHIYSGATTMEPSLIISAANFTHIGMYRCIASNRVGIGFSNFTYLSVSGDIPDIYVLQTSYNVIVKDNITMACNVSASPEVTRIGWLRNTTNNGTTEIGMSNDKYEGGTIDDPFLTIWNVNDNDEGWYICSAENLIGDAISEHIYLNVTGDIPKVQIQEDSYYIILGENVTMGCEIYSHPLNTYVFWLHKTSEEFTAVTIDNVAYSGGSVRDPSLTIMGVRFSDSGEYICVAVNFVGESRSNATTLNVTGDRPLVSVVTTQYNVIEDHNITLSCNVSGVPDVYDVSWTMDTTSGSVNSDRLTGGTITDPSLTVGDTELGDTGWYTCSATNLAGTTYGKPLHLNVTEKCTNYVPTVSNAVLDCVYSNGSGSCRVTCITSYIFREGDSSRLYTCTGKNDWTPPLPMPTCVETVPSTYILIINITYKMSAIAIYCQKSHDNAVVSNYDVMVQQLSAYCNNDLVTVGPIVINSTISTTSSFEITTTYVIIIGNASISKYSKMACGNLVQINVYRDTLLVYSNNLQCESSRSTVNKTVGSFISSEATCPHGFSLVDETYVCVSDIPRIGSTTPLYATNVGNNVTLYCDVVSELAVTSVYWEFIAYGTTETSVITTTNDSRHTGGTLQEESLTISNVSFTDVGIYKCVAVNKAGIGTGPNIELDVTTTVLDRPSVEIPRPLYNVILGDNITLVCSITSDLPITKIQWQKKSDGIFNDVYIDEVIFHGSSTSDPSLTLIGARFIDEGEYLCIATNYAGSENSNHTTLNVTGDEPIISISSDQYTVQFGDNVTLLCDITGVPAVTGVLWLRNDSGHVEIINTSLINYSGVTVSKPSLTILMARITDKGWYICTGTNLAGTATSEQMYLNVTANKPVITIRHIIYNVTAGDNITLECKVFAYPVVLSSSWSRNVTGTFQNIVPDERKLNFSSISEPSLTIKFVELTDSGVYVCQSTNDAGTTYGTPIYLNVIGGSPDVTLMSTYTVLYGNDITMSCIITAVPNITRFKWQTDISGVFDDINTDSSQYFGATLSNHSLTVVNVKFPDAGRYKCIGTNFVGTGSDITTLIVDGGIPSVYVSSTVYHVNIADNVTMYCNVSGSPNVVAMSWQSNTTGLTSNRHSGATLSNPSLTISNVNVPDGGWYVCTATNIVGIGRSMPVYLNVTGDEICTEEVLPIINNAATTCSGSLELLCTITCNDGYVTRSGNVTVYFWCEVNLWRPPLPPQGCIDYVLPYVEYNIQVIYKVTGVAVFCLSSHEQIINSFNSTFAQQATDTCNNEYADIGTLEITDMKSITSSFSITTMYTVKSKMNTATKYGRDLCKIFLQISLDKSAIFTYNNTLSCNSSEASVSQTTGSLVSTREICLGGSSSVVTSRETYCVSDVPSVVILKPSYVAEKGDTITIECNVESNLNVISVYWLHNISGVVKTIYGSETTKYSGSSPLVPSLTVSGVDFTDIGLYTCIAENSIGTGTSASVPLNVIERVRDLPVITTITTSLQFSVGGTATLHCSVNDKSEPSVIFWSLNTNGKYQIIQPFTLDDRYTGSTTTSPSLIIHDVVEEDTGNYTCHAVNVLGVAFGEPIQLTLKGLVTEGNPTAGQSVDDTGILSCVQTFGYMLLFAAIGVVILTCTTILLCICVPNDASSLLQNIGQWKLSDKIAIIVIELYLSMITSCAVAGIYTIMECSEDITGATIRLTSVAIVPGIALAACYLGICTYIQFKRHKKIAVFSDSKGMIPSTSPVPDDQFQTKSWRPYDHSELPVNKHEQDSSTEDKGTTMYAKESDIYASTFRSEPLIDLPSGSTTPGRQSLPPIDYKEHSEERMKRRRRRKKKRKKELFDKMNESNEEL